MKTFHKRIGTVLLAAGACVCLGTASADDSMRYGASEREQEQRTGGTGTEQNNLTAAEQRFIRETAAANLAEVKRARLALERSTSDDIKNYAQHVIDQHSDVNSKLVAIASDNGIRLPTVASLERPEGVGEPTGRDQGMNEGAIRSNGRENRQYNQEQGTTGASERSRARSTQQGTTWNLEREMRPHQRDFEKLSGLSGAEFDKAYLQTEINDHRRNIRMFEQEMGNLKDPELKNFASDTLPSLRDHLRMAQDLSDRRS